MAKKISNNLNSALFESYGHTIITWSTTPANQYDGFSVFIIQLNNDLFLNNFDGPSGTTHLFASGTFYFQVLVANLLSWSITIDVQDVDSSTTTLQDLSTNNSSSNQDVDANTSTETDTPYNSFILIPTFILITVFRLKTQQI